MARVLFIVPAATSADYSKEALGVSYICAYLRSNGHESDIVFPEANYRITLPAINDYDLIGVQLNSIAQARHFMTIMSFLTRNTDVPIVVGGTLATLEHRALCEMFNVLGVVLGEGEHTVLQLVNSGSLDEKLVCPGLYTKNSGVVCRHKVANLDDLPWPSRDGWAKGPQKYPAYISASRGCWGNCSFCSMRAVDELNPGPKWRGRSVIDVVDEMEWLFRDYGIDHFIFTDDNFAGLPQDGGERCIQLAREILKRRIDVSFAVSMRADQVQAPTISILQRAGLQKVFLGLESGSSSVLRRYRKGITVEQNKNAVRTLRECGVSFDIGFIMFDPQTTETELCETVRFIEELQLHKCNDAFQLFTALELFPGTQARRDFCEHYLTEGGFINGDYYTPKYVPRDPVVAALFGPLVSASSSFSRLYALIREALSASGLSDVYSRQLRRWVNTHGEVLMGLLRESYRLARAGQTQEIAEMVQQRCSEFNKEVLELLKEATTCLARAGSFY